MIPYGCIAMLSQILVEIFTFYKKFLIVHTISFEIRVNVNFSKKNVEYPYALIIRSFLGSLGIVKWLLFLVFFKAVNVETYTKRAKSFY